MVISETQSFNLDLHQALLTTVLHKDIITFLNNYLLSL